jgi:hypothetical protein
VTDVNRDHQHGGMEAVGEVSQFIKSSMRMGRNWPRLSHGHREALDMIAHQAGQDPQRRRPARPAALGGRGRLRAGGDAGRGDG